jgi:enoyl reductase-like protein
MIEITLTVPDADHASALIEHLMCDGMMYIAMPITIKMEEKPNDCLRIDEAHSNQN